MSPSYDIENNFQVKASEEEAYQGWKKCGTQMDQKWKLELEPVCKKDVVSFQFRPTYRYYSVSIILDRPTRQTYSLLLG